MERKENSWAGPPPRCSHTMSEEDISEFRTIAGNKNSGFHEPSRLGGLNSASPLPPRGYSARSNG